jgi:hypothetical protein
MKTLIFPLLAEQFGTIQDVYGGADDFSPGMLFFVLMGILTIGSCLIILVGILLIFFSLISFGVLSTSILVGVYQKSFESGFKTFFVGISGIVSVFLSVVFFSLLNTITEWWSFHAAILYGFVLGLSSGVIFGYLGYRVFQLILNYFKTRLNL